MFSRTTVITDKNFNDLVYARYATRLLRQNKDRWSYEMVNYYKRYKLPKDLQQIPLSDWDVSRVTNMSEAFDGKRLGNDAESDISKWNVSNVTNMSNMFQGCTEFNQDLSSWNVSNVTNMSKMFYKCQTFNTPLNSWNVSKVTDMTSMFDAATRFNQPLECF